MSPTNKLVSSVAAAIFLCVGNAIAELPQIKDARIIQPPPGAKVAAAYFTVNNSSDAALVILKVSSDSIKKVEIHLSSVVDDVARMAKQDNVTVPPGESLEFKHGSYHLMLMGMVKPLESGQTINFLLQTSEGPLPIKIPVLTPDEAENSMKAMHNAHDRETLHDGHSIDNMDAGKSMEDNHQMDLKHKMEHGQTMDIK